MILSVAYFYSLEGHQLLGTFRVFQKVAEAAINPTPGMVYAPGYWRTGQLMSESFSLWKMAGWW